MLWCWDCIDRILLDEGQHERVLGEDDVEMGAELLEKLSHLFKLWML